MKKGVIAAIVISCIVVVGLALGLGLGLGLKKSSNVLGGDVSTSATLKSTTLSSVRGRSEGGATPSPGSVPANVTGKALSFLFAFQDKDKGPQETDDDGFTFFGHNRPDIAPADAKLYDFDFADPVPISSSSGVKDSTKLWYCKHIVGLFGYLDIELSAGTLRVMLGQIAGSDAKRGDLLLKDGDTFKWAPTGSGGLTTTRPTNPVVDSAIANFTDSIRPDLIYYPVNIELGTGIDFSPLATAATVSGIVDFDVAHLLTADETASGADFLRSVTFDTESFGGSFGLSATADVTFSGTRSGNSSEGHDTNDSHE